MKHGGVKLRKRLLQFLGAMGLAAGAVLGLLWYVGLLGGNVRAIVPGRAYRSAQLPAGRFEDVVRRYGIKTVISVKGGDPTDPWFREQEAICRRAGARMLSVRFSARSLPPPRSIARLVRMLERQPRPILFHCRDGADRSGLAAALYLHLHEGMDLDEAERRGLTWRYGHLSFRAPAMGEFFDLYRQYGRGRSLDDWIVEDYRQVYDALQAGRPVPPPGGSRPVKASEGAAGWGRGKAVPARLARHPQAVRR